ncbi:MAG: helix-turn-helix domain-containing protein [Arachnia sp.]
MMIRIAPIVEAEEDEGPRGRYRKTAATRARILDAALEVFGEQGFDTGSLREIAERAGVSQAGLLHHYRNKVALLSAVLERRDERASATVFTQARGVERLQAVIEFARENASIPFEIDLFAVLSAEATRAEHPANAYMRRRYSWVSEIMESTLRETAEEGYLHPEADPKEVASQFIALWDGLQIQWLLRVNDVNIADRLECFIDLYLVRPLADLVRAQETVGV